MRDRIILRHQELVSEHLQHAIVRLMVVGDKIALRFSLFFYAPQRSQVLVLVLSGLSWLGPREPRSAHRHSGPYDSTSALALGILPPLEKPPLLRTAFLVRRLSCSAVSASPGT